MRASHKVLLAGVLVFGKINLEDLHIVKKVKGLKAPTYLPAYLRK